MNGDGGASRRLTLVLLILCAGLGSLTWLGLRPPPGGPAPDAERSMAPAAAPEAADPSSYQLPPLEAYGSVLERPLFREDRRPAPPAAEPASAPAVAAAPSAAEPERHLTLVGVVTADPERFAFLRTAAGEVLKLHAGEELRGWTLEDIREDRVVLRSAAHGEQQLMMDWLAPVPRGLRPRSVNARPRDINQPAGSGSVPGIDADTDEQLGQGQP